MRRACHAASQQHQQLTATVPPAVIIHSFLIVIHILQDSVVHFEAARNCHIL